MTKTIYHNNVYVFIYISA